MVSFKFYILQESQNNLGMNAIIQLIVHELMKTLMEEREEVQ